jgi:hypothetical protein
MFKEMEMQLWEYRAGNKYRGFTLAKTEITAKRNAIKETGVNWLEFTVKAIPTPGYKLVKAGDDADDGTGEASGS